MKYFIPMIILSFVLLSCAKKDDDAATTDVNTCTGTSSGSGPTIGSVALEEATYLSSCFAYSGVSKKLQLEFKNSTEAQYTSYSYSDTSCSTLTDTGSMCMNAITVSSTAVTKPTWVDGALSDNASGYNATAAWLHDSTETAYLQFSENSASVFWFNQATTEATRDSNAAWLFKFTKQ
mgnify:CR=1 FL=1